MGLGCGASTIEAWDVGLWEPHTKSEAWALSHSRPCSQPSLPKGSGVWFRLAFGFEAGPVNH